MLRWLIGIIFKSSSWQHIQRLKITILGANWQLFSLERITKCSYFILSTQNIKFHWIVMKIKKFLLPIWGYNRDLFPLRNKYKLVFVLNGLKKLLGIMSSGDAEVVVSSQTNLFKYFFWELEMSSLTTDWTFLLWIWMLYILSQILRFFI